MRTATLAMPVTVAERGTDGALLGVQPQHCDVPLPTTLTPSLRTSTRYHRQHLHVVDIKVHAADAIEQKARQRRGQNDGVPDRESLRRGDLVATPGHRMILALPAKSGMSTRLRSSSGRTETIRNRAPRFLRSALPSRTAEAESPPLRIARGSLHAIDELSIYRGFQWRAASGQVVIVRCRRLVLGEVENPISTAATTMRASSPREPLILSGDA